MFTNELRSLVFVVDERGPREIEDKNSKLKPAAESIGPKPVLSSRSYLTMKCRLLDEKILN